MASEKFRLSSTAKERAGSHARFLRRAGARHTRAMGIATAVPTLSPRPLKESWISLTTGDVEAVKVKLINSRLLMYVLKIPNRITASRGCPHCRKIFFQREKEFKKSHHQPS